MGGDGRDASVGAGDDRPLPDHRYPVAGVSTGRSLGRPSRRARHRPRRTGARTLPSEARVIAAALLLRAAAAGEKGTGGAHRAFGHFGFVRLQSFLAVAFQQRYVRVRLVGHFPSIACWGLTIRRSA